MTHDNPRTRQAGCIAAAVCTLAFAPRTALGDITGTTGNTPPPEAAADTHGDAAVQAQREGDRRLCAGSLRDAAERYAAAAAASPNDLVYQLTASVGLAGAGRRQDAIRVLNRAAVLSPGDIVVELLLSGVRGGPTPAAASGASLHDRVAASRSARALRLAIMRFPDSPVLMLLLGDVDQLAGKLPESEVCYRRAILLAPSWTKPRVNLGSLLLAEGKPADAADAYQSALSIDPKDTQAQAGKGDAYLDAGRPRDAVNAYAPAEQAHSPLVAADAATGAGQAYARIGATASATSAYAQARRIDPSDPSPVAAQAALEYRDGHYPAAANLYAQSLRLSQGSADAATRTPLLEGLISSQTAARNYAGAVLSAQQAVQEAPHRSGAWYRMWAVALFGLHRDSEAIARLKQSLEADDDGTYPVDTLSLLQQHGYLTTVAAQYDAEISGPGISGFGGGGYGGRMPAVAASAPVAAVSAASSVPATAQRVPTLRILANIARYQSDAAKEIQLREQIVALSPTAQDWYNLASARDLRAGDPDGARAAYTNALAASPGLSDALRRAAQGRLQALTPQTPSPASR